MRQSNSYTFIFIVGISLVAALLLSVVSQTFKERQERNVDADMKKNILAAVGLTMSKNCTKDSQKELCCDLMECYKRNINSVIVDHKGSLKKTGKIPEEIDFKRELEKPGEERDYPVFIRVDKGKSIAYCIPIIGRGLWGKIYGYCALEKDLVTVKGITFYKHQETPGLGAKITEDDFRKNFPGKKIINKKAELVSVTVMKGKVKPGPAAAHQVDGITGATITSRAVGKMLKDTLLLYEPYFKTIRRPVAAGAGGE
ncbi:MAG: NADH:ubiquinone reductase (Na(+)-transporting) subunit C [bacterium]|nr:NADH:ubiquinone reductase (Na(+)-transporting) subunit C [bacterium]